MSYCRTGWDSDVHVVRGAEELLECLDCRMSGSRRWFGCITIPVMVGHLEQHRVAGHRVPGAALERLHAELLEQRA